MRTDGARSAGIDLPSLQLGPVSIGLDDLCRHGLISGVTGSGKTNTARLLAQAFSAQGAPVLAIDAKGDFAGISQRDRPTGAVDAAATCQPPPVLLWDLKGQRGHRFELGLTPAARLRAFPDCVLRNDASGAGCVSVLDARDLIQSPTTYAQLVLDLVLDASDGLEPHAPDDRSVRLVLLIEEAHLVFRHIPGRALLNGLRALSSRGVAAVFVSPNPADPPTALAAKFGFWIQHALWTCSEPSLRALREQFRGPEKSDELQERVRSLGIGEALIRSSSDRTGRVITLPRSVGRAGPLTPGERRTLVANSPLAPHWGADAPQLQRPITRRRRPSSRSPRPPQTGAD